MIGRPRNVVTQRLDELIKRGYVEHSGNRYKMTAKLNVPNLQRHMRSNISIIQKAARHRAPRNDSRSRDWANAPRPCRRGD